MRWGHARAGRTRRQACSRGRLRCALLLRRATGGQLHVGARRGPGLAWCRWVGRRWRVPTLRWQQLLRLWVRLLLVGRGLLQLLLLLLPWTTGKGRCELLQRGTARLLLLLLVLLLLLLLCSLPVGVPPRPLRIGVRAAPAGCMGASLPLPRLLPLPLALPLQLHYLPLLLLPDNPIRLVAVGVPAGASLLPPLSLPLVLPLIPLLRLLRATRRRRARSLPRRAPSRLERLVRPLRATPRLAATVPASLP